MHHTPLASVHGRFLHLIPDDKFIDAAHGVFEEVSPGSHDYLCFGRSPLLYLHTFKPVRLELVRALEPRFLSTLSKYSAVFVHFLSDSARLIVASAPAATRFIWFGWGADFYHLIHARDELLLPKTRALLASSRLTSGKTHNTWIRLARRLQPLMQPAMFFRLFTAQNELRRIGRNAPRELTLINRFSAIATPIFEDFEAMCLQNPELRIPFLDWNYWVEGFNAYNNPTSPSGNDILLGNSATPENNHLDALDILSQCLPAGRRIICPLNYGSQAYGDAIEQHGKALFGDRFVALREYMPSSSYTRVIEGCSVVVMNHIRQQALGNIVIALCSGAHVFLNSKNPINRAMRRMEVEVDTTDLLPDFFAKCEMNVSLTNLRATRQKIDEHYGRASILRRTRALLSDLR